MRVPFIEQLHQNKNAPDDVLKILIENADFEKNLFEKADEVRRAHYGTDVYIRGLIEVSNYCKNNCYYCGIRRGNKGITRYRLDKQTILECCEIGYGLGFRTFVLQGGEDPFYTDSYICETVSAIKKAYPDCAVTLSLGEKSYDSFKAYFDAGADRYLLRHETANAAHYQKLHPSDQSFDTRKKCLGDLKAIGYQVGSGFMVGSPEQTTENILEDLRFLQELEPDMIGIGPFLSHQETPFADRPNGDLQKCLRLIALLRLLFPKSLIPATTALGTIAPNGRELGLKAGANVVMPNLSPVQFRKLYALYDHKIATGEEAAEGLALLKKQVEAAGYGVVVHRGDVRR